MIISIKALNKIYQMGEVRVHALKNVTFEIMKGEFVSIMGPSGSGKSTLMNLLGCLDQVSSGEYLLDGTNVTQLDAIELAGIRSKKIGFVFQSFNLLPKVSALRNVELPMIYSGIPKEKRMERAKELLQKVGLHTRVDHKPNQMSGGQKQRVAIARALANKPKIILADEPTGNLDSKTSEEIMALFQQLNDEGVTIILVTHEMDIAIHTQRMLTFIDGCLVTDTKEDKQLRASDKLSKMS